MSAGPAQRCLTIRADATSTTGAGHVMRCLSVAEQWQHLGGDAEIWGEVTLGFVAARAQGNGISMRAHAEPRGRDLLLVDIYGESERHSLSRLRSHRRRVLVDDLMSPQCRDFDAVWNPNAYGSRADYPQGPDVVLAGEEFVPLRPDLPRWSAADARGGAIAFGGGALSTSLAQLAEALPPITNENSGWSVAQPVPANWRAVDTVTPWADLHRARWIVMAAGSMLWEAAAVGIPVVVCIVADNQIHAAAWAESRGAFVFDLRGEFDVNAAAREIAASAPRARALPALSSGARRVARRLWEL